ncbi:FixH family protein [Algimonas porphyrae]|uniref:Cytochrome oxidase n=1 Tax=Algimonas porphyrae TaxID=1128113 RepID=A0ABQ5V251_9PROT|nr:FixH family protein [Algimonas porphyrae]GLQ21633.1 cytochrome oxidase [Algimonas porphyrae]
MADTVSINPDEQDAGWRLTGRHVLLLMVGFFGIIIATSIVFTTLAVTSFRGEDVERSYRQGLDYNTTLSDRAVQSELGWGAAVNVSGEVDNRTLVVQLSDSGGAVITGTTFTGGLRHPVDSTLDHRIDLETHGDGIARADISGLLGQWTLEVSAVNGEDRFEFRRDLDLR